MSPYGAKMNLRSSWLESQQCSLERVVNVMDDGVRLRDSYMLPIDSFTWFSGSFQLAYAVKISNK